MASPSANAPTGVYDLPPLDPCVKPMLSLKTYDALYDLPAAETSTKAAEGTDRVGPVKRHDSGVSSTEQAPKERKIMQKGPTLAELAAKADAEKRCDLEPAVAVKSDGTQSQVLSGSNADLTKANREAAAPQPSNKPAGFPTSDEWRALTARDTVSGVQQNVPSGLFMEMHYRAIGDPTEGGAKGVIPPPKHWWKNDHNHLMTRNLNRPGWNGMTYSKRCIRVRLALDVCMCGCSRGVRMIGLGEIEIVCC